MIAAAILRVLVILLLFGRAVAVDNPVSTLRA
jgi:hypothetical protein